MIIPPAKTQRRLIKKFLKDWIHRLGLRDCRFVFMFTEENKCNLIPDWKEVEWLAITDSSTWEYNSFTLEFREDYSKGTTAKKILEKYEDHDFEELIEIVVIHELLHVMLSLTITGPILKVMEALDEKLVITLSSANEETLVEKLTRTFYNLKYPERKLKLWLEVGRKL